MKDLPTGPKDAHSTTLSIEEAAIIVAFRRHTLLPLDDCLYALQATIPHLTRSSLHRSLQRHEISRLPEVTGDKEPKKKFKTYPIGYFHIDIDIDIDIGEVRTAEGKLYLYVATGANGRVRWSERDRAGSEPSALLLREVLALNLGPEDPQHFILFAARSDAARQLRPHLREELQHSARSYLSAGFW